MKFANNIRDEMMTSAEDVLAAIVPSFSCPVCFEFMHPRLFQCANNHAVCAQCIRYLQSCPMCLDARPFAQNRLLENIASELKTYVDDNCLMDVITPQAVNHHHQSMNFETYQKEPSVKWAAYKMILIVLFLLLCNYVSTLFIVHLHNDRQICLGL